MGNLSDHFFKLNHGPNSQQLEVCDILLGENGFLDKPAASALMQKALFVQTHSAKEIIASCQSFLEKDLYKFDDGYTIKRLVSLPEDNKEKQAAIHKLKMAGRMAYLDNLHQTQLGYYNSTTSLKMLEKSLQLLEELKADDNNLRARFNEINLSKKEKNVQGTPENIKEANKADNPLYFLSEFKIKVLKLVQRLLKFFGFDSSITFLEAANGKRLAFVWGIQTLLAIIDLIELAGKATYNIPGAESTLLFCALIFSYLSWSFLLLRLIVNIVCGYITHLLDAGINLLGYRWAVRKAWEEGENSLLPGEAQHFSYESKKNTELDFLKAALSEEWHARKYMQINDSGWSPINAACSLWLLGSDLLFFFNNLINLVVLVMDEVMSILNFREKEARYHRICAIIETRISHLMGVGATEKARENLRIIAATDSAEIVFLKELLIYEDGNAPVERKKSLNDIFFTAGTLVAYWILALCLVPPSFFALPVSGVLFLVGAFACYGLTALNTFVHNTIEVMSLITSLKSINDEIRALGKPPAAENDEANKATYFMNYQQLENQRKYTRQMIEYQIICTIKNIVLYSFIPAVCLCLFIFLPMPASAGIMVAVIVLAAVINRIIKVLEPQPQALSPLPEENILAENGPNSKRSQSFMKAWVSFYQKKNTGERTRKDQEIVDFICPSFYARKN